MSDNLSIEILDFLCLKDIPQTIEQSIACKINSKNKKLYIYYWINRSYIDGITYYCLFYLLNLSVHIN